MNPSIETAIPGPRSMAPIAPVSASALSGEALDREIARRVLALGMETAPPFSTDEAAAEDLANRVANGTGWRFEISERGDTWSAMWIELPTASSAGAPRRLLSLVTATAPTRPLAICRALLKAARSPRWPRSPARSRPLPPASSPDTARVA
jgi:hypothetical protein